VADGPGAGAARNADPRGATGRNLALTSMVAETSTSVEKYRFEDFTEAAYCELLAIARSNWSFARELCK